MYTCKNIGRPRHIESHNKSLLGTVVIAIRYISTKLHVLGIEVLKNIHLILNMKPYAVKLIFSLISKEMA